MKSDVDCRQSAWDANEIDRRKRTSAPPDSPDDFTLFTATRSSKLRSFCRRRVMYAVPSDALLIGLPLYLSSVSTNQAAFSTIVRRGYPSYLSSPRSQSEKKTEILPVGRPQTAFP